MDDLQKIISHLKQFDKRLSQLENNKVQHYSNENSTNNLDTTLSSKMQSRIDLMQELRDMYPNFFVTIAKRVDGGGLLLTDKMSGENYRLKFFKSKNWSSNRLFGWFTIRAVDVYETTFDFYVMSLDYENTTHNFIFNKQEILTLVEKKKSINLEKNGENTQEEIIHFYIEQQGDHFFETREINQSLDKERGEVKGGIDVSHAYNNLKLIGLMTGETTFVSQDYVFTHNEKVIKNLIYEMLKRHFLIPIRKSDYVLSGALLGYIEFEGNHKTFKVHRNILDKLKRVVLCIDIDKNMSISNIDLIKESVLKQVGRDTPLIIGVSLNESNTIKSSIVFIGEYLVD